MVIKMDKRNRIIIWLLLFIFLIVVFVAAGTYAFFTFTEYRKGDFDVEITSKGVDTLTMEGNQDVFVEANVYNFSKEFGHDVVGETEIAVRLDTTNKKTSYEYEMVITLPDEIVFEYSDGKTPELVLNVSKSTDSGRTYTPVILNKDITQATGIIKIPIKQNSEKYVNTIATTKRKTKMDIWKVTLAFVWLENVDQTVNDQKSYKINVRANILNEDIAY